jgi:hypothetical protein
MTTRTFRGLASIAMLTCAVWLSAGSSHGGGGGDLKTIPERRANPEIESLLPELRTRFAADFPGAHLYDLYSVQSTWRMNRHAQSGLLVSRETQVAFAFWLEATGKCGYWVKRVLQENLSDDHWGEVKLYDFDGAMGVEEHWIEVDCPTVEKNAAAH